MGAILNGIGFEYCWLDIENIAGFVAVESAEELEYLLELYWLESEYWAGVVGCCDAVLCPTVM